MSPNAELDERTAAELKRIHGDELYRVETTEGDVAIIRATRDTFHDYLDGVMDEDTAAAASETLAIKCTVWPERKRLMEMLATAPGVRYAITSALDDLASGNAALVRWTPWEESSKKGVPEAEWERIAKLPGASYTETSAGPIVLRRPTPIAYDAYTRQLRKGKRGPSRALHQLLLDCTAYPATDVLQSYTAKYPGLPVHLKEKVEELGGLEKKDPPKRL